MVHPDKNQDDLERANNAFETVNRAWRTIDNDESRKKCLEIIQEAKDMTEFMVVEKRKKLKKEGKDTKVEEDDPAVMKRSIYVQTCKLFADLERKRKDHEARELQERKRKREQEIDEEQKATVSKEWQKNFDVSFVIDYYMIFSIYRYVSSLKSRKNFYMTQCSLNILIYTLLYTNKFSHIIIDLVILYHSL